MHGNGESDGERNKGKPSGLMGLGEGARGEGDAARGDHAKASDHREAEELLNSSADEELQLPKAPNGTAAAVAAAAF